MENAMDVFVEGKPTRLAFLRKMRLMQIKFVGYLEVLPRSAQAPVAPRGGAVCTTDGDGDDDDDEEHQAVRGSSSLSSHGSAVDARWLNMAHLEKQRQLSLKL